MELNKVRAELDKIKKQAATSEADLTASKAAEVKVQEELSTSKKQLEKAKDDANKVRVCQHRDALLPHSHASLVNARACC